MTAFYAKEPLNIELSGTRAEFEALAVRVAEGGAASMPLVPPKQTSPYDSFAQHLVIRPSDAKVAVRLVADADVLELAGSPAALALLAENLDSFGRQAASGGHFHLEFFDGHFYLAESSAPLVCVLADRDESAA
ncbi:MAG: hypothetical protein JSR82_14805 [Verrucomicrobia bacterium]|nr:hypothetical protein [Verrucomicrobiota bacterium]